MGKHAIQSVCPHHTVQIPLVYVDRSAKTYVKMSLGKPWESFLHSFDLLRSFNLRQRITHLFQRATRKGKGCLHHLFPDPRLYFSQNKNQAWQTLPKGQVKLIESLRSDFFQTF